MMAAICAGLTERRMARARCRASSSDLRLQLRDLLAQGFVLPPLFGLGLLLFDKKRRQGDDQGADDCCFCS